MSRAPGRLTHADGSSAVSLTLRLWTGASGRWIDRVPGAVRLAVTTARRCGRSVGGAGAGGRQVGVHQAWRLPQTEGARRSMALDVHAAPSSDVVNGPLLELRPDRTASVQQGCVHGGDSEVAHLSARHLRRHPVGEAVHCGLPAQRPSTNSRSASDGIRLALPSLTDRSWPARMRSYTQVRETPRIDAASSGLWSSRALTMNIRICDTGPTNQGGSRTERDGVGSGFLRVPT